MTEALKKEIMDEFDKTKFATGGGCSFECSDYEEMYVDLKDFLSQAIDKSFRAGVEASIKIVDTHEEGEELGWFRFKKIAELSGLTEQQARKATRALVRKGLAKFSTLFDEDGMCNGSGHHITTKGYKIWRDEERMSWRGEKINN